METDRAIRNGLALLTASLRQEVDAVQVKAYLRGLKDIPADVVLEGADELIRAISAQPMGKRYFPTVPDWFAACASVVDERRKRAARQARALQETCDACHGSGWADAEGPNAVERCWCAKRAIQLLEEAGDAISRPALPAHDEPEPS